MKKLILLAAVTGLVLCLVFSFCTTASAQKPLDVYYHVATTEKVIALTFDDGPHPHFTDEILKILEKENIRATFFAIGSNVEAYPDVMRRVMACGHEIGNHTYNHPIVHTVTDQQLVDEIEKTDEILRNMGYYGNGLFRPPQGKCPDTMPALLERTNKTAILWNIDTRDWAHRPSAEIVEDIESHVCGGDIILFHDYVSGENTTIPALKKLIPMLKARGYQFVTVSELLSLKDS
jgi:peptidoglycan/xylan/chitin deacetylase (PgdA/CDA1 family)